MAQEEDPNLIDLGLIRAHVDCWWCGADASKERTFKTRLTPLSRTAEGVRHTLQSLRAELEAEVEAWKKKPYVHGKCSGPAMERLLEIEDQVARDNADAQRLHEIELALMQDSDDPAIAAWMQRHGFKIADKTTA